MRGAFVTLWSAVRKASAHCLLHASTKYGLSDYRHLLFDPCHKYLYMYVYLSLYIAVKLR